MTVRPFIMQDFFSYKKGLFAPPVCDSVFELPCTSVASYARLYVKTIISLFSYYTETTHVPRTGTRYRYQVFVAISSTQQLPRSYCCTKWVTHLESSHGHHLPTRAALRVQLADVVSTPSEWQRQPDAGRARQVQSIVSALYAIPRVPG